jgi:hypothetical protein
MQQNDYDKLLLNEKISVIGYMTESEKGKRSSPKEAVHLILRHRDGTHLIQNK